MVADGCGWLRMVADDRGWSRNIDQRTSAYLNAHQMPISRGESYKRPAQNFFFNQQRRLSRTLEHFAPFSVELVIDVF